MRKRLGIKQNGETETARTSRRENGIVIATIVLCFAVTLGLCFAYGGKGFLGVMAKSEATNFYAVTNGGYQSAALARQNAELLKERGAAGYVYTQDGIEVILAVYPDKNSAEKVMEKLGDKTSYIKEFKVTSGNFKWCGKALKKEVDAALSYFNVTFEKLYNLANSLEDNTIGVSEVVIQIDVLNARLNEIKADFVKNTAKFDNDELTEIKLGIITAQALVGNVTTSSGTLKTASSLRYQAFQCVLCHKALMAEI